MSILRLRIPVHALNWQHEEDCAACLLSRLQDLPAIQDAAVQVQQDGHAEVRIEYDESRIDGEHLEALIRRDGACRAGPADRTANGALAAHAPTNGATTSASRSQRVAACRSREREPLSLDAREPLRRWLPRQRTLLRILLGGLTLLAAVITHAAGGSDWLRGLFLGATFLCTVPEIGMDTLRTLARRRITVDALMFMAAFGAMAIDRWEEGALLLFLFALGREGERLAMRRARSAIRLLGQLTPETALRIAADGTEAEVPIEDLAVGDVVRLLPFDRVPADGEVLSGRSAIDQAPITGESIPVEKGPGDPVFAGTMNSGGTLTARVTKPASDSTIGRILRLVEAAQQSQSPTQRFTDKLERVYVPIVLVITAALIFLPPWLAAAEWQTWFYRAMAFLTAAAPCALAIGTPAAVLCGIARSARAGILIKGGAYLEALGGVRAVAFDKTGTLTRGEPSVVYVIALGNAECNEDEALRLAAAVEAGSSHPLAGAIHSAALERGLHVPGAEHVRQEPGRGASGDVTGRHVVVGRREMIAEKYADVDWEAARPVLDRLNAAGCTIALVAVDGRLVAAIGLADRLRPTARATLDALKKLGIAPLTLLTGDNPAAARPIAEELGVDACYAGLMPEEKMAKVRELRAQYGSVAMIGDGVNDAPALADATVGVAMGGAGRDIAMETADVVLMADAIEAVPRAIAISRFSRRIIAENLVIALGTIVLLAPSAALGYVPLGLAVAFHEGSTILVVMNALRILGYRPPDVT